METMGTEQDQRANSDIGFWEFVALMAAMTSLSAMSTDAMLPALPQIGADLGVANENLNQLVVSLLFFGMAAGQLVFGPMSDSKGRKPAIYAGYGLFIVGSLCSMVAGVFWVMLAGRLLQGLGAAGPRSVCTALIRDKFAGRRMARVMSFIATVFILVPVIAPVFGQLVLMSSGWRAIFAAFLVLAILTLTWFALRQPETLPAAARIPWSVSRVAGSFKIVLTNRVALGYTIAAGIMSGAFFGYLNSAQQIFGSQYELGSRFALVFAVLALSMGTASFMNARMVMKFGMRFLAYRAALIQGTIGFLFLLVALTFDGHPPLWSLMLYLMATFLCTGILFGNTNALAMEPLGKVAGVGAAVVGSIGTFIATPLGMVIGQSYNQTVIPLVLGFTVLGIAGYLTMRWVNRGREPEPDATIADA